MQRVYRGVPQLYERRHPDHADDDVAHSYAAEPNWDELGTPSHTGALSEVFRTRYAEARSIHPTHSVGAGVCKHNIYSRDITLMIRPCRPTALTE